MNKPRIRITIFPQRKRTVKTVVTAAQKEEYALAHWGLDFWDNRLRVTSRYMYYVTDFAL